MLLSQVVVNLPLKLGQRVNRVADHCAIGCNLTHGKHNIWTIEGNVLFRLNEKSDVWPPKATLIS
jgi:hypothetical protein